jgi:hypothetical protein
MGVGIHGEPGRRRVKLASADEIAVELTGAMLKDLALRRCQEAILPVNGCGGRPKLELYRMVDAALKVLPAAGMGLEPGVRLLLMVDSPQPRHRSSAAGVPGSPRTTFRQRSLARVAPVAAQCRVKRPACGRNTPCHQS